MQRLKRRMIRFVSVILGTILGALLVLGEPVFAQTESATPATPTPEARFTVAEHLPADCDGISYQLEPNTAYKVDRTSPIPNPESKCYGKTARVKFTFHGDQFPGGKFEEIYPIQDGWDLFFNTPASGYFQDVSGCGLRPQKANKLALLSGFKSPGRGRDKQERAFCYRQRILCHRSRSSQWSL